MAERVGEQGWGADDDSHSGKRSLAELSVKCDSGFYIEDATQLDEAECRQAVDTFVNCAQTIFGAMIVRALYRPRIAEMREKIGQVNCDHVVSIYLLGAGRMPFNTLCRIAESVVIKWGEPSIKVLVSVATTTPAVLEGTPEDIIDAVDMAFRELH